MASAHELARGHKRLRALIEFALSEGWKVVRTRSGHLLFHEARLRADLHQLDGQRPPRRASMPVRSFAAPTARRKPSRTWHRRRRAAMADLTQQDIAAKLLASGFERSGPSAAALTDPIADTPMVVTLDQLRPYDHDPRVTRNRPTRTSRRRSRAWAGRTARHHAPAWRAALHHPQRRQHAPGHPARAVGETKDERFFRIPCLFRPWPQRGEVVMLTGHLAENELRGGLSFIERALGVEKAREFYEQEMGRTAASHCRRASWRGGSRPMASRCRSLTSAACRTRCTTCCRRSRTCCTVGSAAIKSNGSRCYARPVNAPGSDMRWAAACRWTSPRCSRTCSRSSTRSRTTSRRSACRTSWSARWPNCWEADYDTLALEIDDTESRQRALTSDPAPPQSARPAVPAAPAPEPRPPSRLRLRPVLQCSRWNLVRPCRRMPARQRRLLVPKGCSRTTGSRTSSATNACRGPHRVAGDDHRAPAIHPAHGRRPDGRQAARLRGQRAARNPVQAAGSTHLGRLVHRARPGRAGSAARSHRAVRA